MGNPVKELLDAAKQQGFTVVEGRHYKVYSPDGRMTTIPRTPGDHRSLKNCVRYLKQLGFQVAR